MAGLGDILTTLTQGASTLAYAAQTYLPNHPQTANAATSAVQLAQMLEPGAHSTVPSGVLGDPTQDTAQANTGFTIPQIMTNNAPQPGSVQQTVSNLASLAGWLDFQRVAFLVLGIGLMFIGATLLVRSAGDPGLDINLKRAQLKLANDQVAKTEQSNRKQTLRAQRVQDRTARRRLTRPTPAFEDHASHARPDFGKNIIDVSPVHKKEGRISGFSKGVENRLGKRKPRREHEK